MTIIQNKQKEKDLIIKNILVENGVIENPRVVMCGRWFNKISNTSKNKLVRPIRYFCMRWECRMCRRTLMYKLNTKHNQFNDKFIKEGGKIILIKLSIPQSSLNNTNYYYRNLKRSIFHLKESRGWKKIKVLSNCHFHFNNIEITYKDNEYHMCSHINYGILNNNISIYTIKRILLDYWRNSTILMGFSHAAGISVETSWLQSEKYVTKYRKQHVGIKYCNEMDIRDEIKGTLENLEIMYIKVRELINTKLKSFKYIKEKELYDIGRVIKQINIIQKHSKRGRIWTNKQ